MEKWTKRGLSFHIALTFRLANIRNVTDIRTVPEAELRNSTISLIEKGKVQNYVFSKDSDSELLLFEDGHPNGAET